MRAALSTTQDFPCSFTETEEGLGDVNGRLFVTSGHLCFDANSMGKKIQVRFAICRQIAS
jgi:hypothetical protein